MKKKIIALLLTLCLTAGLLAGCASTTGGDTGNDGGETTTVSFAKVEVKKNDVDLAGKNSTTKAAETTTTAAADPTEPEVTPAGELPITKVTAKMTWAISQAARVSDYEDNLFTNMMLEDCNVDFDFVMLPSDQPTQKFELMVASGETLPDVMVLSLNDTARATYGKNGVFIPTNDMYDEYGYWYWQNNMTDAEVQTMWALMQSPDGNLYGFPRMQDGAGDRPRYSININHKWLNTLGLEMPDTTDEFRDTLIAFRDNDPNGNGQKDEIPWLDAAVWDGTCRRMFMNSFIHFNEDYFFNLEDGKVTAPFVTDEWREGLTYLNGLLKDGLLAEASLSLSGSDARSIVDIPDDQTPIVGVFSGHYLVTHANNNRTLFEYDVLPIQAGPEGVAYHPNRQPMYQCISFITKDCKYPEIAFRVFDYWCEEERGLAQRYGETGVHWDYRPLDPAGFDAKYPYRSAAAEALDFEVKHIQIPGVDNPWTTSEPTNAMYCIMFANFLPLNTYSATAALAPIPESWEASVATDDTAAHRNYISKMYLTDFYAQVPDEEVTSLVYLQEEMDQYAETMSTLKTYILEAYDSFIVGNLDISGNDWDTYVDTLYAMGLEDWINLAQTAYDRMYA